MQISGNHCSAHQAASNRGKQNKNSRPWSTVSPAGISTFCHEDWPYWRCNSNSLWFNKTEGRTARSQVVSDKKCDHLLSVNSLYVITTIKYLDKFHTFINMSCGIFNTAKAQFKYFSIKKFQWVLGVNKVPLIMICFPPGKPFMGCQCWHVPSTFLPNWQFHSMATLHPYHSQPPHFVP